MLAFRAILSSNFTAVIYSRNETNNLIDGRSYFNSEIICRLDYKDVLNLNYINLSPRVNSL
jgi:hypothetical protein